MEEETNEVTLFDHPCLKEGGDESTLSMQWQPVSRSISGALSEHTQEPLLWRRVGCHGAHRWHGMCVMQGQTRGGYAGSQQELEFLQAYPTILWVNSEEADC